MIYHSIVDVFLLVALNTSDRRLLLQSSYRDDERNLYSTLILLKFVKLRDKYHVRLNAPTYNININFQY